MPAPLFVIASSVDHKLINRLLLHLRDWEYGEAPTWDNFHLVTSATLPETDGAYTTPPITENDLSNNQWAGKSISDIESYMRSVRNKKIEDLNLNTFIVLDDQGAKDGTIVLLDMPYDHDNDGKVLEKFNKVRVPWEKTYIMWCNLDIANMDFTDFVGDEEEDEAEWWSYKDFNEGEEQDAGVKERKNNAVAELQQKGLA